MKYILFAIILLGCKKSTFTDVYIDGGYVGRFNYMVPDSIVYQFSDDYIDGGSAFCISDSCYTAFVAAYILHHDTTDCDKKDGVDRHGVWK